LVSCPPPSAAPVPCGSIRHDRPASLRQTRTCCRPAPRPARRRSGPAVATRGQPPGTARHPASLRPSYSSSWPSNPVLARLAPVGHAVRLALAITNQGTRLSNPHSAAVMSRGFVQCASFRQPQSPAQRADGLFSDGRGLGLAERTLSFCTPTLRSPKPRQGSGRGCAFTTRNAFIRRTATGRPGRSTKSNAGGHRDDRLCRTVPLPPFAFAPMPTGTSTRKDLEIDHVAVTLRLAPAPMASIDTAQ
jgi:hypothetical protein